jgi:Leucine-rich repeat (LRR) protein
MNKSGSNIDVAALERCFVAVKASPYPHPKFQAAITRSSPSSIVVAKQRNASSCMKDARSPTPNAGGTFSPTHQLHTLELLAPRDIQAQLPKLPAIHAGRARIAAQSTDAPASHSKYHRHPAAPFLIKPSTLEENGHQDDNGNVVSSICVGLGAMGFDLYDSNFDYLESVDLGDNKIIFADAAVFPSLKMLNLYCNGIQNLEHPASAFRDLEVLNLSFNAIHPESLLPLFAMKTLVVLDLSFNTISRIPNRWHSLPLLKVLSLEKNGLYHAETFTYLSLAPSLQELNLSSNKLSSVPASCSAPGRFPQLSFISLVDNRFAHERDVVALSFVPSIQQVDLWNNPMSSNSGARTRSRHALQRSRSPSPEQKGGMTNTAEQEGFLRVMTPANFNHHQYAPTSSHTAAPAASYSTRPRRAMADIEREARDVFSDGYVHLQSLAHS